ncbi:MAG: cysteine desulfurase [Clostridiales bacterium]|nr:cysteine desulfurase [Clostridiales bacterium]
MEQEIYLDNAATTPVLPEVVDDMVRSLTQDFGNPSSLHRLGLESERQMKQARGRVAGLIQVPAEDIIFTSGGTESNNLAILGTARARKRYGNHCITTQIEHPSVLNSFKYLEEKGWDITYLPVDKEGVIDIEEFKKTVRDDTVLVSMAHVNNEIGSIQPIREIGLFLKNNYPQILFHTDAVQSFGRIQIRPFEWGIDLLSASGHKVHGPKGIGALYIKKGTALAAQQWGGGQELGIRSGTENLPGIVGFGRAAQWVGQVMSKDEACISRIKLKLTQEIAQVVPEAVFLGPRPEEGAPHILGLSIPGVRGETLLHVLESQGVYVSTGSACSSRNVKTSYVLGAIGVSNQVAEGAIRLSFSYLNTSDELSQVPNILRKSVDQVKRFTRR